MKLTKNGIVYNLTDETQITAFVNSGFERADETKKAKVTISTKKQADEQQTDQKPIHRTRKAK